MVVHRKARAKINLALDVVSRRPDGYHEVRMIMQALAHHDELTFERMEAGDGTRGHLQPLIHLTVTGPAGRDVPADATNLAFRAAEAVYARRRPSAAVMIRLVKNIPAAAGLGGGSADAAAVFHGLNELFALGMDCGEMMAMGEGLGADIPFCLLGGTAVAEGVGGKLTVLPPPPPCTVLVAWPEVHVSTGAVYAGLDLNGLTWHPDIDGMAMAIRRGDMEGITRRMGNVLETVTVARHPVVARLKERLLAHGAGGALMSGSGPGVFALFDDEKKAIAAADDLRREAQVFVTAFAPACS